MKQGTVSKPFAESEYGALSLVAGEVVWLKHLLGHFEVDIGSTMFFCYNKSTIHLASNPSHHERSKHQASSYFLIHQFHSQVGNHRHLFFNLGGY